MPAPCGLDDFIEISESSLESKLFFDSFRIGREARWIARSAGALLFRDGVAGDASAGLKAFPNRIATSDSDVVGTLIPGLEGFDRGEVRFDEIGDVHVISDAGAIRCRVVGAVDRQRLSFSQRDFQTDRNQMTLRSVVLADAGLDVGACDVEISQGREGERLSSEFGRGGGITQHPFRDELGATVRIHRILRAGLVDGKMFLARFAVTRAGAREDEAGDPGFECCVDHRQTSDHVVVVIAKWFVDRFSDVGECGEMHHRIDSFTAHRLEQSCTISDIHWSESDLISAGRTQDLDGPPVASVQIVDDMHEMSGFDESQNRM